MSFLTGQRRALFLVLAARIVPETVTLDAAARARMLALVEDALSARPVAVRRELAIFLRVLQWVPALRYGRPLDRLDALRQDAALRWFQDAPLAILRSGFWGVKTLVYLGYYGRPELGASIGYRPAHDGNRLLRHTRE